MTNRISMVDIGDTGPADKDSAGGYVPILVRVTYPGSVVSDILIGDTPVKIYNDDLRAAIKLHDDVCDTEGG